MNQQLIPVFNGEIDGRPQQLCNAQDLHQFLEVQTRFNDWMARRIEQYGFVQGEDFYSVLSKSDGGRPATEYHLTLDMAKELAMVENNEQGRQVRRYFIALERQVLESRGATYLSVSQQLAIHRQVPRLLAQLKAETVPAIRATLHAQLTQHCHLLALPVPSLDKVGRAAPENGELFPATQG
ncbi:antA/AntB antirepressor family protein [Pseudomonas sp. C9-3]|uniref:antA/AntB antirepressor family protein n=1 Tax=Pseudomonas sp. C9-3 TaxID=3078264 RepID=UPI0028E99DEE|nr:antA/AntB antirepressor family protein [Pseudomonas sp. C9-3]